MTGRGNGKPHPIPRTTSAAYPLIPIPSSRNLLDEPDGDNGQEMSRPRNDSPSRETSPHSTVKPGRSHPPYLPLPTDVPTNPDSPISEQVPQLIHESVHPHSNHQWGENLFGAEDEPDEADGDAPVIAKELEEMQSRVWWKRPSALWYALIPVHTHPGPLQSVLSRDDHNTTTEYFTLGF